MTNELKSNPVGQCEPFSMDVPSQISVQVTKLEGRQRQVEASIDLPFTQDQVWDVLTNYDALSEFIPNLTKSCRVEHPDGGIRVEQIGSQSLKIVTFSARVILDMTEHYPSQIQFDMVEGDFKAFSGAWILDPVETPAIEGTRLTYRLQVWPKPTMPVIAIEQRLRKDLPANLKAIQQRLSHASS